MFKYLSLMTLVAITLAVFAACGGDDPTSTPTVAPTEPPPTVAPTVAPTATTAPTATPAPTATAVPTPTRAPDPTATPSPSATEVPASTPAPTPTASTMSEGSGSAFAPLPFDNPFALASEFSQAEIACMLEVTDLSNIMMVMSDPEAVTPEEQAQLLACMNDENLMRLYLTETLLIATGPLSVESSDCIREGFAPLDLHSIMAPGGMSQDPTESETQGIASFIVMITCINDDEWDAAAPVLGLGARDAEGMDCMLDELGGAIGVAEALAPGAGGPPSDFIAAMFVCEVESLPFLDDGDSSFMPSNGDHPNVPGNLVDPATLLAQLSAGELSCLTDNSIGEEEVAEALGGSAPFDSPSSVESRSAVLDCLFDDSVLQIFLTTLIGLQEPLSTDTFSCIGNGFASLDIRGILNPTFEDPFAALQTGMVALNVAVACMNDDEWGTYADSLDMIDADRLNGVCLMTELGGPAAMTEALLAITEGYLTDFVEAAESCGIDIGSLPIG